MCGEASRADIECAPWGGLAAAASGMADQRADWLPPLARMLPFPALP